MATLLTTHAPARTTDAAAAARAALRDQVARLERELATYPVAGDHDRPRGARMLGLAELERVRDDLVERVHAARAAAAERDERERDARARLEAMLADPAAHPGERVRLSELGLPGCGSYQVRPRLGLIGMLRGWWVVKLSSGCPLAPQPRDTPEKDRPFGALPGIPGVTEDPDDEGVMQDPSRSPCPVRFACSRLSPSWWPPSRRAARRARTRPT